MSGGPALGRLGVAGKRPADQSLASQTLGQDSGEKAQRQYVGLEGRRVLFLPGGDRAAWTMALGHVPTPRGLEGWSTGLPYPTDSLFPPLSCPSPRALADLAGAGALHSEARGGAGSPDTAALRHEPPTPPGTRGRGEGPISCIWLD